MSDELILRLIFDNTDAAAKIEEVNKMLEKLGINWLKNLDKVSKVVSNLVSLSKIDTRQAVTQVSNKSPEDDESKNQKEGWWVKRNMEDFGKELNKYLMAKIMYMYFGKNVLGGVLKKLTPKLGESLKGIGSTATAGLLSILFATFDRNRSEMKEYDVIRENSPAVIDAVNALGYFKNLGDPIAELIWQEYKKGMDKIAGVDSEAIETAKGKLPYDFLQPQELVRSMDELLRSEYKDEIEARVWAYKHQAEAGALVNEVLGYLNEKLGLTKDSLHDVGDEFENSLKKYDDFIKSLETRAYDSEREKKIYERTDDPFKRPYFTSDFLENLPREQDFSDMAMLPPAQQPEVDMQQWFLDNVPREPDLFNQVMLPPSSSGKAGVDKSQTKAGIEAGAGGTLKSSGFFGGMKESFWSGVDQLKQQFGLGGDKGLLGNLFGGGGTGGGLFGMLGSFAGPQSGLVGTIQQFASMLPGIGGMISNIIGGIGDFIKDINTELFLFIKYNYSLQHRYAKVSSVGAGYNNEAVLLPVRAGQWDAFKY